MLDLPEFICLTSLYFLIYLILLYLKKFPVHFELQAYFDHRRLLIAKTNDLKDCMKLMYSRSLSSEQSLLS